VALAALLLFTATGTAAAAGWSSAGRLHTSREFHPATTLPDGRVLVSGGFSFAGIQASAELFDPAAQAWQNTFPMSSARFAHTATLLADGRVLVAGGANLDDGYVAAAELFDPQAEAWQPAGQLRRARANHTASLLADGRVLVAGGLSLKHTELRSAEIYDPATSSWSMAASMRAVRYHHTATTLPDGRVLVTGGDRDEDDFLRSAEIYDPRRNRWTRAPSMRRVRGNHSATLLPDGRVLHAGSGDAIQPTGEPAPDERNGELFSPPYLFRGVRPAISSAPGSATYGGTFFVGTPDSEAVTKVSLIALGSVTHAFDMTQRFSWLSFARASGGLNVTSPQNRNLAPPGFYLLFILNGSDVPSVAKIIQLK